jgi:hypothetical protein
VGGGEAKEKKKEICTKEEKKEICNQAHPNLRERSEATAMNFALLKAPPSTKKQQNATQQNATQVKAYSQTTFSTILSKNND